MSKYMKVSDLIKILEEHPQDLDVVYECCSENVLMSEEKIKVKELCLPRPDGWVANKRPDKPSKRYLVFPGN